MVDCLHTAFILTSKPEYHYGCFCYLFFKHQAINYMRVKHSKISKGKTVV